MVYSSSPLTKEKEPPSISCENHDTKRRKSQSNSRRIRWRGLQSLIPPKINIQSLPEDIVPRITSKLTLKEAAQMSVLSSMWAQAWTFHPNLCFNIKRVLGSHAKREDIRSYLGNEMLTVNKFIERVDVILKNHGGTHVNQFAVEFGLSMEHANSINRWILFAIVSKARILILNFSPNRIPYASNSYNFPFQLFDGQNGSYLQVLQLDSVTLGPSPDFCGFANLRMLALYNVLVLQDLNHLISKCCVLEWLSIRMCFQLPYLHVTEPLRQLKYLCIQDCAFRSIEFCAPNLTTFEYRDSPALMNLNECLKLKTATIRLDFKETLECVLTGIPSMLPHVETLCLELRIRTEISGYTQSLLKFSQLRHLTMDINFLGGTNSVFQLSYLLQAAPHLEDLHLKMFGLNPVCCIDLDDILDLPHYHLKTVCITGFCGNGGQVELAKYILNNALILEHLILKPGGKAKGSTSTVDARFARKEAKEKLAPFDMDDVLTIL